MSEPKAGDSPNGAEAMVRMLQLHGVKLVFGLCGDTSLLLYDALYRLGHDIDPGGLAATLQLAIEHDGPTLVDIVSQPLQDAQAPVSNG